MTPTSASATSSPSPAQSFAATRLHRIVVGTDFSDASRVAVMAARDLAAMHGAQLTIVHATDPMVAALEVSPEAIIGDARAGLRKAADAAKADDVNVGTEIRLGKPWWVINEVAKEIDADLVVVASHGRTGIARVAMGSTADRVLRSSGVPVLVIPVGRSGAAASPSPRQWKHALAAIDFSDESMLALKTAARLLGALASGKNTLTLFHTVALTVEFRGPDMPLGLPQHWDQAEAAAAQRLEQLANQGAEPWPGSADSHVPRLSVGWHPPRSALAEGRSHCNGNTRSRRAQQDDAGHRRRTRAA